MRIISKFHDYYDPIQAMGQDRSIVYIRNREVHASDNFRYRDDRGVIHFCGEVFPFICVSYGDTTGEFYAWRNLIAYDIETLDRFAATHPDHHYTRKWGNRLYGERWNAVNHFSQRFPIPLAEKYPIVVEYNGEIVCNEMLKKFDFQKVVDPYSAFQRIQTFLSNIAIPIKPLPKVDDKIMAESKGFNRWSFRKMPEGKKK